MVLDVQYLVSLLAWCDEKYSGWSCNSLNLHGCHAYNSYHQTLTFKLYHCPAFNTDKQHHSPFLLCWRVKVQSNLIPNERWVNL